MKLTFEMGRQDYRDGYWRMPDDPKEAEWYMAGREYQEELDQQNYRASLKTMRAIGYRG